MRNLANYWTKERCQEVALKCDTRNEFCEQHKGAYLHAWRKDWLDELCSHMKSIGNLRKRLVYSYEFSDNYVYVGLTCNDKRRERQHHNEISPVNDHIRNNNLTPIKKILSNGYVDVQQAQFLETFWIDKYRNNNWNILNKKKAGGLGSNILYWTKEKCCEVALKCRTRKEFSIKYVSAYINSRNNKWLDEICSHMIQQIKPQGYWDYETCKEASLTCSTKFEFSRKCSGAYYVSNKNKWLSEFYLNR